MNAYRITIKDDDGKTLDTFVQRVSGGPGLWLALQVSEQRLRGMAAGHDAKAASATVERVDKYDLAYEDGYQDGLNDRPPREPEDDSWVNYVDGYSDGELKRKADAEDAELGPDLTGMYRNSGPRA